MPAEQPEQPVVNLLEHDVFEESPIGRIVTWATTYGRYIMITTEIVVLLAFVSRFSLDRKRVDLDEAIESKRAIIEVNQPFEKEVRSVQAELSMLKVLLSEQPKALTTLRLVKSLLPQDVYLETYNYDGNKLAINAVAATTRGFMVFMNNLQASPQFIKIDIGEVKKTSEKGITMKIAILLQPEKKQVKTVTDTDEKL
jgi:Tfp pilus assembly protein PilN